MTTFTMHNSKAGRSSPATPGSGPDPNFPYLLSEFLDDHRRLLSEAAHPPVETREPVQPPDGRLLTLLTTLPQQTTPDQKHDVFSQKYDLETEASHLLRFQLVLQFLDKWRCRLPRTGLGDDSEPVVVREELVTFLLRYRTDRNQPEIPGSALSQFLDEWSHRWI